MSIEVFEELKAAMAECGLSIVALAQRSGVTYSTLARWRDGQVDAPRIDTMLKVAMIVGREIELTGRVKKMVRFYPPPKPRVARLALWRLQ